MALDRKAREVGMPAFNLMSKMGIIRHTAKDRAKAVFFSKLIIITALVPIFSFQKVEGKMFSPLAYTLGFALLGALIFTLTLVPVLSSMLLKKEVRENIIRSSRGSIGSRSVFSTGATPVRSGRSRSPAGSCHRYLVLHLVGQRVSPATERGLYLYPCDLTAKYIFG